MTRNFQPTPSLPHGRVHHVLVSREQIARRVAELAGEITSVYEGRELTIVVVLTGALTFTADLIRRLPLPLRIEPVAVSSYTGEATRPKKGEFRLPLPEELRNRDVLIVDDIFDSGQTMAILVESAYGAGARDVKRCVLLRKDRPDLADRGEVDYFGFDIPDEFVVGYGLDFNGYYRNLPDIGVLQIHAEDSDQ
ncbi:MAG: hypoxanthine phosphoribosyltransferase [Phycisphaerae bacterium]|nr:hypoxanthine phosphoribosyltransferase [Phycisphaerae bacterium]